MCFSLVLIQWRRACDAQEALAHMHTHGLCHCDIKPSNIFLDSSSGWGHCRAVPSVSCWPNKLLLALLCSDACLACGCVMQELVLRRLRRIGQHGRGAAGVQPVILRGVRQRIGMGVMPQAPLSTGPWILNASTTSNLNGPCVQFQFNH